MWLHNTQIIIIIVHEISYNNSFVPHSRCLCLAVEALVAVMVGESKREILVV